MSDVLSLAQQYLDFAKHEVGLQGKPRADTTMTSYRRAIEGFSAAVINAGLALDTLPKTFIQNEWMATQISVHHQPIQLRVRVSAVKHFINWMQARGVVVAPCDLPTITTTPKKKEQQPMSDITYLTDQNQLDPVPAAPSQVQLPQAAVQPPPPAPPRAPQKRNNPLANLLPQGGGFKLRVRREREGDDPSFIGDFPAEQVAAASSVESFLQRVVGPRMLSQGITGDVAFQLSALSPGTGANGAQEGERTRLTIAIGGAPVMTPVAPAVVASAGTQQDLMETITTAQRAQEELAQSISKHLKEKPVPQQNTEEMSELKAMVASLATSVNSLAQRVEYMRDREPMPQQTAPQANDTLGVINAVAQVFSKATPVQQPPMSMEAMFMMMAKAKDVFAPQNVSIDTSPLEEQIADLKSRMKKDDLLESMTKFKQLKELFQEVGGETSASKPTGLGAALGNLLTQVVSNPEPIAAAAERVLGALAVARGVADAKPPSQQRPQLPPELLKATLALLETTSPEAAVGAAHEWLTLMQRVPQTQAAAARFLGLVKEAKTTEAGICLRQVASMLGFKEQASADRCANIAKAVVAQVQQHESEEEVDEEPEAQGPADLNIRVGGVQAAGDDADDGEGEEDEEGEEGEEAEGADDAADDEADGADEEGAPPADVAEDTTPPAELPDDFDSVVEEVVAAPKRGRKARKQAAATPPPVAEAEADTTTLPVF